MSIASELTNLEGNIGDAYDAVNDMSGIIPQHKNMANLDQAIRTIPQSTGPTPGDGVLTIQQNGTALGTFSANQSTNVTANITVPTKTSDITNDSDFVTSSGTVAKANQLTTPRTIGISGGATGTATSFNGTANISIPITDVKDSYVTWGGKPIYNAVSPDDAGCIDEFGHNKLAFLPANCIQVHYSTDGGSTWVDYGLTDAQKIQLVTDGDVKCMTGGETAATSSNVTSLKVRIRIATAASTTTTGSGSLYTDWRKVLLNVNDPNSDCNMTMRYRTIANYKSGTETWVGGDTTYPVRGGSGWNSIPKPSYWPVFGGNYSSQTAQIGQLEFVLSNTKLGTWGSKKGIILSIRMIGLTNWQMPSELARTGRLYTIDAASKNATFPASIYAGSDISAYNIYYRGGTTYGHIGSSNTPFKDIYLSDGIYKGSYKLTLPNKAGTVALTSDIPGVFTGASASAAGTTGIVPAPAAGDESKVLRGDGTWAAQNEPIVVWLDWDSVGTDLEILGTATGQFMDNYTSATAVGSSFFAGAVSDNKQVIIRTGGGLPDPGRDWARETLHPMQVNYEASNGATIYFWHETMFVRAQCPNSGTTWTFTKLSV